jgi:hypothetical protein
LASREALLALSYFSPLPGEKILKKVKKISSFPKGKKLLFSLLANAAILV